MGRVVDSRGEYPKVESHLKITLRSRTLLANHLRSKQPYKDTLCPSFLGLKKRMHFFSVQIYVSIKMYLKL